jgi:hypothetical protein
VSHIFSNLNFAIKSVADNAFLNSKDNELKEKALNQLFKNLNGNLGDTFRRWRELNKIEKLRERMNLQQRGSILKMLENLLHHGKNAQIRDAINKFRTNRKITDIQRNFLKRLLMSKAGMVVIAFRKIQTLPENEMMKPMPKPTNSRKDLAHSLTEPSRNHSKLSRANGKKVKLSRRDQSSNLSTQLWVDKRKCMEDGWPSPKEQDS